MDNRYLVSEPVGRLMLKYSVPCVISLLVGALYNIVDQIYIGWGVGYLGNGATNVVFPLTVAALAVATMIGDGACTFVSLSLGSGDRESAHRAVGNAVVLSLLCSLILTAVYFLFMDDILRLFGATQQNISYARDYFTYIAMGVPFYMFTNAVNPIIRSDGSPRFAMLTTLAGAILNVGFDAIAVLVLGWGVAGAAIATVAGQVVSAALSLAYLFRMKTMKLHGGSFVPRPALTGRFVPMGFCSFLSQISVVVSMAATNNMLVEYGSLSEYGEDIPLTVLGIVMKVFQIVISVSIGMAAGCIPVVGYNIGAGRRDRALEIMRKLLVSETVLGLVSLVVVEVFPSQLIGLFGSEDELYMQFAVLTFRIYLSMIVLACVNKASFIFLQSMGKAGLSTFLSLLREVILGVPLVMILPAFFGLRGVLYSMPLADILAFAASAAVIVYTHRRLASAPAAVPAELSAQPAE